MKQIKSDEHGLAHLLLIVCALVTIGALGFAAYHVGHKTVSEDQISAQASAEDDLDGASADVESAVDSETTSTNDFTVDTPAGEGI